jgi:hypothetical protein
MAPLLTASELRWMWLTTEKEDAGTGIIAGEEVIAE